MFAVIVYFWKSWRASYFANWATFRRILLNVVIATIATGAVGLILQYLIERVFLSQHGDKAEVELLFSQLPLIAAALFAAGLLIIYSGMREERNRGTKDITTAGAAWIGIVQGLCLPRFEAFPARAQLSRRGSFLESRSVGPRSSVLPWRSCSRR
jgi:undecaprenyl-diphosphatase